MTVEPVFFEVFGAWFEADLMESGNQDEMNKLAWFCASDLRRRTKDIDRLIRDIENAAKTRDEEFTLEKFASLLEHNDRMLKSVMIGKDAVLVGISNSTFQDVAHLSNIHPKRKASDLSPDERNRLFKAIKQVVSDRIRLGGKVDFVDFYGNAGDYHPVIDSSAGTCRTCGTTIQKLAIAGGATYFCPRCQRARYL